jgi:hypothetical protein
MISQVVKKCDIFGYLPHMKINKKKSFNTTYGGFFSILIILTILYSIWHFGNEIIFKRQPSLITTTYNDEDPLKINLTDSNFAIALGLQTPSYVNYLDESIYTISAVQNLMKRLGDGKTTFEKKNINMIPCNRKEFKLIPDYFKLMDLKNLYCIENNDIYLEGDFGRESWAYLEFSFKRCKNSTLNNYSCIARRS